MRKPAVTKAIILAAISIGLILLDQLTKWVITAALVYGDSIPVIDGFFSISHVLNTGAAWGVLSDHTWLLSVVTFLACMVLIYLLCVSIHKGLMASLVMILSGALGNLADRIFRGEVVDFLSFRFGSYNFPSFNVADICITCGCILLVIIVVFVAKDGTHLFQSGSIAYKWFGTNEKKKDKDTEREDVSQ